jgi:GntR family transcriptional regulator
MLTGMLDAASPLPLYHQLADALFSAIRAGSYAPGDKIPSEHELAQTYGIGRPTVRQATETLIQRGVLVRKRGSGTYVRSVPIEVDLFSLAGTLVSFEARGIVLNSELIGKPKIAPVREPLHPMFGRDAVHVVRLSNVQDKPVLLEELAFDADRFPSLGRLPLKGRSLSELVRERYGMRAVAADQSFRVESLGKERAQLLGVPHKTKVLRVDRSLHFDRARAAVFARMFCRTEELVFSQRIGANPP